MGGVVDDVRQTVRRLVRRPQYPTVAVVILALGLSASIAVFTYVNGFSRPFPGVETAGLVRIFAWEEDDPYLDLSFLDFLDYQASGTSFRDVAAVRPYHAASVRHENMTEVAFLEAVTGNYFGLLEVPIALGRGLLPDDDRSGAESAAVISHGWWQQRFHGDPDVLGSTVFLNYRPFTVVGVASPDYLGSTSDFRPHVWIPIAPFRDRYTGWDRQARDRDVPLVRVYARLADGVSGAGAEEQLAAVARSLDVAYPAREQPRRVRLAPATWIDPRDRLAEQSTNRVMVGAAAGFLFLVCANVANLLLSVFGGRGQELALQAALGASGRRRFSQVVTENVILAGLAGGVALFLALPLSTRLGSYFARPSVWGANVSRDLAVDGRVVLFALGISLLTGLAAALLPAIRASRTDLLSVLKGGGVPGGAAGRSGPIRARDALVAAQVALCVVLLVVAGLVLRTLESAGRIDPGFAYESLVASHVSTSSTSVTPEEREAWFHTLAEQIEREPWVRSATVSGNAPLSSHAAGTFRLEDQPEPVPSLVAPVHAGFFETMGVEILAGRAFTPFDTLGGPDVAVINEPLAARYFPDRSPVGRRLWWQMDDGERVLEVVGVVGPTRVRSFLAEPEPAVYLSYRQQRYPTGSALVLSVNVDPYAAVPLMERWLRDFEPHMAIVNALPYLEVVRGSLYAQRMNAELFAAMAVLGLVLASLGVFSVVRLGVSRRTREIGVRKALGAKSGEINRMVVRQALGPVMVGLAVGLGVSFAAAGLVRGLLYGVEPSDPATLVAGCALLLGTALTAAYLPARGAGGVDPISALRAE
jgi:predicted permease